MEPRAFPGREKLGVPFSLGKSLHLTKCQSKQRGVGPLGWPSSRGGLGGRSGQRDPVDPGGGQRTSPQPCGRKTTDAMCILGAERVVERAEDWGARLPQGIRCSCGTTLQACSQAPDGRLAPLLTSRSSNWEDELDVERKTAGTGWDPPRTSELSPMASIHRVRAPRSLGIHGSCLAYAFHTPRERLSWATQTQHYIWEGAPGNAVSTHRWEQQSQAGDTHFGTALIPQTTERLCDSPKVTQ